MPIWRLDQLLAWDSKKWHMLVAPSETILIPVKNWTQYLWGCFCMRSLHAMCIMLWASEKQQLTQLFWINETNVTINGWYKPSQNRRAASMPVQTTWKVGDGSLRCITIYSRTRSISVCQDSFPGGDLPIHGRTSPFDTGNLQTCCWVTLWLQLPIWHVKHRNFSARHEVLKQSSSTLAASL